MGSTPAGYGTLTIETSTDPLSSSVSSEVCGGRAGAGGGSWASVVKNPPAEVGGAEARVRSLGREDPGNEPAARSSVLAWEVPRTEEPGGLQP